MAPRRRACYGLGSTPERAAHPASHAMKLKILDIVSTGATAANEDRAGAAGSLAWVIDGATDVLETPLVGPGTDAAWFAEALHREFGKHARAPAPSLSALPAFAAAATASAFARCARRPPRERHENPSAAAVVVGAAPSGIDILSLGDCALIAEIPSGPYVSGISERDAGDRWVVEALAEHAPAAGFASPAAARALLWPKLRIARNRLNTEDGYGIFSTVPTPERFVKLQRLSLAPGARVLLASDGLTRLVDVFRRTDANGLFDAALTRGIASLVAEVRTEEASDADCTRFPRAKAHDDATGLLLRVV